ncbi:MAG TPA: zf-HC2 domain-containing protein [Pyrinomonadaceae bacterium]|nr:zf-HC2 domain-containing protein [Pyrinomonadaceae bacterium]
MNCQWIEQILPLHLSDDVDASETARVVSHLGTCADCARLENEYRQAMAIFRGYEPPVMDDAVYANLRLRVLSEITVAPKPSVFSNLVYLFRLQYRWALALVLLFAITIFVVNRPGRTNNELTNDGSIPVDLAATVRASDQQAPESPANHLVKIPGQPAGLSEKRYRRATAKAPDTKRWGGHVAKRRPQLIKDKLSSPANDDVAILPSNHMNETQPVLRVEMQTKDPNIRIIWFSKHPK